MGPNELRLNYLQLALHCVFKVTISKNQVSLFCSSSHRPSLLVVSIMRHYSLPLPSINQNVPRILDPGSNVSKQRLAFVAKQSRGVLKVRSHLCWPKRNGILESSVSLFENRFHSRYFCQLWFKIDTSVTKGTKKNGTGKKLGRWRGGGSQDTSLDRIARKVIVHKDQLIYWMKMDFALTFVCCCSLSFLKQVNYPLPFLNIPPALTFALCARVLWCVPDSVPLFQKQRETLPPSPQHLPLFQRMEECNLKLFSSTHPITLNWNWPHATELTRQVYWLPRCKDEPVNGRQMMVQLQPAKRGREGLWQPKWCSF